MCEPVDCDVSFSLNQVCAIKVMLNIYHCLCMYYLWHVFCCFQIADGDILCYQKRCSLDQHRHPNVSSFFEYVHNRQVNLYLALGPLFSPCNTLPCFNISVLATCLYQSLKPLYLFEHLICYMLRPLYLFEHLIC